jgi:mRNA interferase HigB
MRIISKKHLVAYWTRHPGTEQPLKAWHEEASAARWQTLQDIKNQYRNASVVGQNRVVFNIKGNDHRLIVAIAYQFGAIYIKFIGTHAEYDRIDAATINME